MPHREQKDNAAESIDGFLLRNRPTHRNTSQTNTIGTRIKGAITIPTLNNTAKGAGIENFLNRSNNKSATNTPKAKRIHTARTKQLP
jgi:hypothetical protein